MSWILRVRELLCCGLIWCSTASAADWPMWRCDASRTAASQEELANDLRLIWKHTYPSRKPAWDDPLNIDLMTYDRVFEPIAKDGRLFIGFNDSDKLVAFDAETGHELWCCYTEAPVRLAPVAWENFIYFCSDDGYLYCVHAADGKIQWRFRGGPSGQHVIGNQRLTSAWPARGGPVVRDETVYFAASIWPFMGVFIYAIDARTGDVQWVNDRTGSNYIKQPHSAPSFAGVAPQGALVATEKLLLVPGGRSVPAALNREDGTLRYFEINAGGKGTGGSFVAADHQHWYVHTRRKGTRAFHLETGVKTAFLPNEPVLAGELVYSAETDKQEEPVIRAYDSDQKVVWEISADGRGDLILAGEKLYAAGEEGISAIRLPIANQPAEICWSFAVNGQVERLIAADQKLFAVTLEGEIFAFGDDLHSASESGSHEQPVRELDGESMQLAKRLYAAADAEGFAFWFGEADDPLIDALAGDSPFTQLAFVNPDSDVVDRLRRRLDAAGVYGRVTVHEGVPQSFQAPKYVAHMVFVGSQLSAEADEQLFATLYQSVRPYGGVMYLLAAEADRPRLADMVCALNLEQAQIEITEDGVVVRRQGALPGSADWTHQHGDVANTIKSDDRRVKLPLGLLWFGGSSNTDVLPRHGHGPPEQVVGGRLFIQGINSLSARDVYTGRVLWQRHFDDLGTFDVYYDETYKDAPLNPQYNQVHIPGANGRGTNFVATADRVYILEGSRCHVLNPATGETMLEIELPLDASSGEQREWGYVGVYQDVLIGGMGFARYRDRHKIEIEADTKLKRNRAGFGSKSLDRAASIALVAFDRKSGQLLWQSKANHSFWHNGVVAGGGKVYCLDKNPRQIEDALKRRGQSSPDSYRIVALDYRTGEVCWEVDEGIFGTWLGYSESHDLLLQAGAAASDRLYGEVSQGMAVYNADDGSVRWKNQSLKYAGPCILHNDYIITNANSYSESAGAFRLDNGEQKLVANPLTGDLQPWKVTRAYGCNNIIASENLLTFRSGAAGFYDLLNDAGTGNFGGFKSGCTSNLVVANGVLNSPDYTRTCSCAYQNQTSLAMVHMPELEFWTVNSAAGIDAVGKKIKHVGINFGAPGDRRDANGLLWLEYPKVAGDSPPLKINVDPEARYFQHHSSALPGQDHSWILASGVEGVSKVHIELMVPDKSLIDGIPVADAKDDGEENGRGEVELDSNELKLGDDRLVGLRFQNIAIAPGDRIAHAYIQFTCDEATSEPASFILTAQDSGNGEPIRAESHDLSARSTLAAEVAWNPGPWLKEGDAAAEQRSPDLAELIRAVTSHEDWESGNSIVIFISGVGERIAHGSRGRGDGAARLIIELEEDADDLAAGKPLDPYRLRLFFGAPPKLAGGERVFDVLLQGERVLENLTIKPSSDGTNSVAIETFENILLHNELQIEFQSRRGQPLLSGVELTRQPE